MPSFALTGVTAQHSPLYANLRSDLNDPRFQRIIQHEYACRKELSQNKRPALARATTQKIFAAGARQDMRKIVLLRTQCPRQELRMALAEIDLPLLLRLARHAENPAG